ncbi:hypothetical protein MWU60_13700 [Yoonia sp. F2084L]|uniref:hypothetical protein n=1 Tax=Yoonia sp. F2084L TaxID=2926419 RepID=UPI001FF5B2F4|nr:hypothetical protein [Yoonia sp. F2084L]MCK0096630.1 hypothetical protein [Yoonia sp. F2084L]
MRNVLVGVCMVIAGAAAAQDTQYLSADGGLFSYEKNRHGAVLKSVDPSGGSLLAGTSGRSVVAPGNALYLGRSCDAFSLQFGDGRWSATDGGFLVEFPGVQVVFPGQEIDVVSRNRCRG